MKCYIDCLVNNCTHDNTLYTLGKLKGTTSSSLNVMKMYGEHTQSANVILNCSQEAVPFIMIKMSLLARYQTVCMFVARMVTNCTIVIKERLHTCTYRAVKVHCSLVHTVYSCVVTVT